MCTEVVGMKRRVMPRRDSSESLRSEPWTRKTYRDQARANGERREEDERMRGG